MKSCIYWPWANWFKSGPCNCGSKAGPSRGGRDPFSKTLEDAKALGLIEQGYSDPVEAVQGADLIVLALPVRATQKILEQIKPHICAHTILTDVGSTKGNVVEAAKAVYGTHLPPGFVPGHPIAGSEHTGVYAGKVDLFANHKVILTPLPSSASWAVDKLIELWEAAQAEVICMDVENMMKFWHIPVIYRI